MAWNPVISSAFRVSQRYSVFIVKMKMMRFESFRENEMRADELENHLILGNQAIEGSDLTSPLSD